MKQLFVAVDSLLRGKRTTEAALRESQSNLGVRTFGPAAIVLGAIFGLCMASYAIANRPASEAAQQALAAMVKLPALFLITLIISFPSLYVFNVLVGCRLGLKASLRLLVSAVVVNLAVAASLGPIVAFFALSTQSYPFMVLLNVAMLALGGLIGLSFLARSLRTLATHAASEEFEQMLADVASRPAADAPPASRSDEPEPTPLSSASLLRERLERAGQGEPLPRFEPEAPAPSASISNQYSTAAQREHFVRNRASNASLIFWVWVLLYGAVGAQTGWLLRPFIGHPSMPFAWFRPRSGNFFLGVFESIHRLLS